MPGLGLPGERPAFRGRVEGEIQHRFGSMLYPVGGGCSRSGALLPWAKFVVGPHGARLCGGIAGASSRDLNASWVDG